MLKLKTFQIAPEGFEIQDEQNETHIKIHLSGKQFITGGIVLAIILIGFILMICLTSESGENMMDFVILISVLFGLICALVIAYGIILNHSALNIDIDGNKNVTLGKTGPLQSKNRVTFFSNQRNQIYMTMNSSGKGGTSYHLHIKSTDNQMYTLSELTNIQKLWVLYTLSEVFNHKPEPLGPIDVVSEFVGQLNCVQSSEPESERRSDTDNSSAFY